MPASSSSVAPRRPWLKAGISMLVILAGTTGSHVGSQAERVSVGPVTLSSDCRYAFPVAADPGTLVWTRPHWDGGNAVDIDPARHLTPDDPAFRAFQHSEILAPISGLAFPADNQRGGIAVIVQGDDGMQYYLAHLAERYIQRPTRVSTGQTVGRLGATGRWSRFLDPHLHMSIASRHHNGLDYLDDLSAAEWLLEHFGLRWDNPEIPDYPADIPDRSPLMGRYELVAGFDETRAEHQDRARIVLRAAEELPQPVIAPMTGQVSVYRSTSLGLRVQITNRHSAVSVFLAGLQVTGLVNGQVVAAGQVVGTAAPGSDIEYMVFYRDRIINPETLRGIAAGPWD